MTNDFNAHRSNEASSAVADKTAAALSEHAFAKPNEFLTELRKDMTSGAFGPTAADGLDKSTLEAIRDANINSDVGNVARIAAQHFDEIVAFRQELPQDSVEAKPNKLYLSDVQMLEDVLGDKSGPYLSKALDALHSEQSEDLKREVGWTAFAELSKIFGSWGRLLSNPANDNAASVDADYQATSAAIDAAPAAMAKVFADERAAMSKWT